MSRPRVSTAPSGMTVLPLTGLPSIRPGDDLPELLAESLVDVCSALEPNSVLSTDVLVVAQKVVSKAEGAFVNINDVTPTKAAIEMAAVVDKDPRLVEVILANSARVVRSVKGVLITETLHGFICANAGVDASNSLDQGVLTLLPEDPDRSARQIRQGIEKRLGASPAVVISDSFNRPWREGSINVAIGTAGFSPLADVRGTADDRGQALHATVVSVADEIASAAQLVMGETGGVPAAVIRGLQLQPSDEGSSALLRKPEADLFR
jgi:coenzyme F420-0:L-glutamate ligase/coenzyme F420-1:gamma-L-glutamate ligase